MLRTYGFVQEHLDALLIGCRQHARHGATGSACCICQVQGWVLGTVRLWMQKLTVSSNMQSSDIACLIEYSPPSNCLTTWHDAMSRLHSIQQ